MTAPPLHVPDRHATPSHRPRSGLRTVALILGFLAAGLGLALLVSAAAVTVMTQNRDADGYYTTGPARLDTETYAFTARDLEIGVQGPDVAAARDLLGRVRIEASATDAGTPLFIGIAPRADVDAYLADVGHAEVGDIDVDPLRVTYLPRPGGAPAAAPAAESFWTASQAGAGTSTLVWDVQPGAWAVVVMNADGSPGVHADVTLGGSLPVLRWIAVGLFVVGGVVLAGGLVLVILALATRPRSSV
jgi:hypothetical protein